MEPGGHYSTWVQRLCRSRGIARFPLIVEGKHAKEVFGSGDIERIGKEYGWLLQEIRDVSERERIGVFSSIPQQFEHLPQLMSTENLRLGLFVGGGFSGPEEEYKTGFASYRKAKDIFSKMPQRPVIGGIYGEGHIGSQFHVPQDNDHLNFYPPYPFVVLEVVNSQTGEKVKYHERGLVIATRVTQDFVWRWNTGDEAERTPPIRELEVNWDGIRNVRRFSGEVGKNLQPIQVF